MKLSAMMMVLLMTSCAASQSKSISPWRVEVKTSGGITGRGNGNYAISSDGNVRISDMAGKQCSFRATDEELRRFEELLTAASPDRWSESYAPENRCCDRIEYVLTVELGGQTKTVEWIDDPLPMPKDLTDLANALTGPAPSLRDSYQGQCR